jgi:hypothetical protein
VRALHEECVCSAGGRALRVHSRCTAPAVPGRRRARGVRTCGHCIRSALCCVVQVGRALGVWAVSQLAAQSFSKRAPRMHSWHAGNAPRGRGTRRARGTGRFFSRPAETAPSVAGPLPRPGSTCRIEETTAISRETGCPGAGREGWPWVSDQADFAPRGLPHRLLEVRGWPWRTAPCTRAGRQAGRQAGAGGGGGGRVPCAWAQLYGP